MSRLLPHVRRHGFEAVVAVGAIATGLIAGLTWEHGDALPAWVAGVATALIVLPLLARRRFPFAGPAGMWAAAVIVSFVDGHVAESSPGLVLAGMAAAFLLGDQREAVKRNLGLVIATGGAAIVVANQPGIAVRDVVSYAVFFGLTWVAGTLQHERAVRAEQAEARASIAERQREAAAQLAVAEERVRIARELHDIVAHSVSVMVLQTGAVRHRLAGERPTDAEALLAVERTGRTALAEMRRLLSAMRRPEDDAELAPQPGMATVGALLDEVRRAGLPVELRVTGEMVPLPQAIDLSAYRIVQEGLTNALKHARARSAEVRIRYEPDQLHLEVRDDGRGPAADHEPGHGLVGIRERVSMFGGAMTATTLPTGGFMLATRLPIRDGLT